MAQRNIDFGAFPDDPDADAIRSAFEKVQLNFTEVFAGLGDQAVVSVNKTAGPGVYLVNGSPVNGEERPSALFLVNSVLRDVWPEQANLVNVERAGRIASITFDQGADSLLIELP